MSSRSKTIPSPVFEAVAAETDVRWKDFIETMKKIGVEKAAWSAHINEMQRVRANVVGRQIQHNVKHSVESIIRTGNGPPIYFIHSVLGTGIEVLNLADMLGPGYQLFSIRPSTADHNAVFPSSVEDMARKYVEELRKNQSPGPLVLVGRSAGVVVALHMRELLIGFGYDVRLLVALDFAPYGTDADVGPFNFRYNYQKMRHWAHQLRSELERRSSYASIIADVGREICKRVSQKWVKHANQPGTPTQDIEIPKFFTNDEREFVFKFDDAVRRYRYNPSDYSKRKLRVLAYTSTKEPDRSLYNVEAKWRKITRNVEVVLICGTHRDIVERPNVILLVNHLRNLLDEPSGQPGRSEPKVLGSSGR